MRHTKSVLSIVLYLVFTMFLVGCQDFEGYTGDYPELFSVAINSVPNAEGSLLGGEITHQPILCLIEEDEYSRKMFVYSEIRGLNDPYGNYDNRLIYLLICQNSDDKYARYYKDINIVATTISDFPTRVKYGGSGQTSGIKEPLKDFSEEMISKLKKDNDWNEELRLENCIEVKIVRKKS